MARFYQLSALLLLLLSTLAVSASGVNACEGTRQDHTFPILGTADQVKADAHSRQLKQRGLLAASRVATDTTQHMMRATAMHNGKSNIRHLNSMTDGVDSVNGDAVPHADQVASLLHRRNLKQRGWLAASQVATDTTQHMMRVTAMSNMNSGRRHP